MAPNQQQFGKYLLLRRLASGGMGEVHLAKLIGPSGFEKLVVIKRLLEHRLREKKYVDMFFGEARVAAQLSHSNIVQVYEVGELEDTPYIAMEYVHGKNLRKIIDTAARRTHEPFNGRIPLGHIIQIFSQLCFGLSFAHNARHHSGAPMGLVHRDVNPLNVLVSYQGEIKIIDFGIAKSELTLEKTQVGTIKGTVVYMSPEQSLGHKLDKRSDLFSVGICLYEAITGQNPFHKATLASSLEAIRAASIVPLEETHPHLTALSPILAQCLAKRREDRFPDCRELGEALMGLLERGAIARPTQPLPVLMSELFSHEIQDEQKHLERTDLFDLSQEGGAAEGLGDAYAHTGVHTGGEEITDVPSASPGGTKPSLHSRRAAQERGVLFGTRTDAVDLPPEEIAAMAAADGLRTGEEELTPTAPQDSQEHTRVESMRPRFDAQASDYEPTDAPRSDTFVGPYSDVDLRVGEELAARAKAGLGPVDRQRLPSDLAHEETVTPSPLLIMLRPLAPRLTWALHRIEDAAGQLGRTLGRFGPLMRIGRWVQNHSAATAALGSACALVLFFVLVANLNPAVDEQQAAQPGSAPEGSANAEPVAQLPLPSSSESPSDAKAPEHRAAGAATAPGQAPSHAAGPAHPTHPGVPHHRLPHPALHVPNFSIDTDPPAAVRLDGVAIHGPIALRGRDVTLQVGDNPASDPFLITLHVTESEGETSYAIDARPWAQVMGPGGVVLGRTPLRWSSSAPLVSLEFKNPHRQNSQRVVLHHGAPPAP